MSRGIRCGLFPALVLILCGLHYQIRAGSGSAADGDRHSHGEVGTVNCIHLEDQFGQRHDCTFPAEKPVVLFAADRQGNERLDPWIVSVSEALGQRVTFLGVADVRGVPGLFQGKVKRRFREVREHPVLMDWNGEILNGLQPQKGQPNVYLIARSGVVVAHGSGEASSERVHEFLDRVVSHLDGAASDNARERLQHSSAAEGELPPSAPGKASEQSCQADQHQ